VLIVRNVIALLGTGTVVSIIYILRVLAVVLVIVAADLCLHFLQGMTFVLFETGLIPLYRLAIK
jgi:hypothetical protein